MTRLLRILGALWLLPVAMPIWLVYVLPLWALGWIAFVRVDPWRAVIWRVTWRGPSWWIEAWRGWAGHTVAYAVIVVPDVGEQTIRHELRHADQWAALGPLFPVAYPVLLAVYGYTANPLERDARRAAQVVA